MRPEPPTIKVPFESPIVNLTEFATILGLDRQFFARIVDSAPTMYSRFLQPKKSGGYREISPPQKALRVVQRSIYNNLNQWVRYPRWMTGGVPKRSIFTHAKPHIGKQVVGTFDIMAFFPSVTEAHIRSVFERFCFSGEALDAAVRVTTLENRLPQGSPASCFLANLVFDSTDRQIYALCRKHGFIYTRYVDDMAISGEHKLCHFQNAIAQLVQSQGFAIAKEKVRFMQRSGPQIITNLCVNDKLRPTKSFISSVNDDLWECIKVGGPRMIALERGMSVRKLKNQLQGRIAHIGRADRQMGQKLRGKMHGINWAQARTVE